MFLRSNFLSFSSLPNFEESSTSADGLFGVINQLNRCKYVLNHAHKFEFSVNKSCLDLIVNYFASVGIEAFERSQQNNPEHIPTWLQRRHARSFLNRVM